MNLSKSGTKVFIESSVLFQLGPKFENVDFEKLIELKGSAQFDLLISEVTWQEYLRERKKELQAYISANSKAQRILESHGKSMPEISEAHRKASNYLTDIDAHYRARIHERGIQIIPLVSVPLERLLKMSIDCIPPFEEPDSKTKEKGFRDSLIMFSILEFLRLHPGNNAIVLTNDVLLCDGLRRHAPEFEVDLQIVPSIDEAVTLLERTILEGERLRLKRESAEAIEMLMQYDDNIAASVYEIQELSESDLGQPPIKSLYDFTKDQVADISGVVSMSFDRIDSAIWKSKDQDVSRILFRCLCKAVVLVSAPHLGRLDSVERSYKIGGAGFPAGHILFTASTHVPTEQRELFFHVYGEAQLKRSGTEWKLAQLRIDKSLPPTEEYYALAKAEVSPEETPRVKAKSAE